MEGDQAGPSAARRLFDLPVSCLHHIVGFMDGHTKLQFFRTSKGSQDEPGCAVLVLRASKLQCVYTVQGQDIKPRPAFCGLLHWASQISADMELILFVGGLDNSQMLDVLHSLLLYPDARASPSGRVLGKPATYPGIISLSLWDHVSVSFIPGLVADALPNLKSFTASWRPDESQPLGPVVQEGLKYLHHVRVSLYAPYKLTPAATQHTAQQLSHLPSLTSIDVHSGVSEAVPAAALCKLKKLVLHAYGDPTAKAKAALTACSQLESLELESGWADGWVQALPQLVSSIRALGASIDMTDQHMPSLIALPHLTSLTVERISRLSDDYSSAPCSWKHFRCRGGCSNDITKLPLHALDSPVQCSWFSLALLDYAADLTAIRTAKPHLLNCGGIKMNDGMLMIAIPPASPMTKEQAAELLQEWAPCLSRPMGIATYVCCSPRLEDALAQLWPGVPMRLY